MYEYRLPVLEVVKEAYLYTAHEWRAVLKNALPLILLFIAISALALFFSISSVVTEGIVLVPLLMVFAGIPLAVAFAVSIHRHLLLGTDDTNVLTTLSWKRRHWRFLGWAILITIGMGLLSWLFILIVGFPIVFLLELPAFEFMLRASNYPLITEALGFLFWIPVFFIICPALLQFPTRATEASGKRVEYTFELARHNRGRLTGIFILGEVIPFTLFQYALVFIPAAIAAFIVPEDSPDMTLAIIFGVFVGLLFVLFAISWLAITAVMLSIAYKRLSENVTFPDGGDTSTSAIETADPV